VYERGGAIQLEYFDDGTRVRQSLQHSDRERAKQQADDIAAKFGRADQRPPAALTLSRLFDMYEKEVTPTKAPSTQSHDRRAFALFLEAFAANRRVDALNVRDWASYIARRRSGELAPASRKPASGKALPVRDRAIEEDCKLLLAVLNWAERARDDRGQWLLERNPLRGLRIPKEEAPRRPVMTEPLFGAVRAKAAEISATAELFVALLWFTGHRAASVRQLRWDDVDLDGKTVHWRAEVDKIGYDHRSPLHPELVALLQTAHTIAEVTGDVYLFPSTIKASQPMSRDMAALLWRRIADATGIKAGGRIGTHSFRRAFANRLRNVALRELKDLGGWKNEHTVIGTYLQPDLDAQRTALERL
jgi:integrase